jgi:hypothetical protein
MVTPGVTAVRAFVVSLAMFGLAAASASAETVRAVEYYHQAFEHYFVTSNPAEIAALDSGMFQGWWRTGQRYRVDDAPMPGLEPVCRFFTAAYAGKASHFFTASATECEHVKTMADWTYEGVAFYARQPDAQGNCSAGTAAIHRLYNNGQGGAPNHAYTAAAAKWKLLVGAGWVSEGVAYCTPLASGNPLAQTQVLAGSIWDLPLPSSLHYDNLLITTRFAQTVEVSHRDDEWWFASTGLPAPVAFIVHSAAIGPWHGESWWEALSGEYAVFGDSGFPAGDDSHGEAWTFDGASGPSTQVCAMVLSWNYVSVQSYRLHPFQPSLWSGCEPGVAYRH